MVADREEKPVDLYIKDSAILPQKAGARDAHPVPQDFLRIAVPEDFDILAVEDLLLHGLRSAENVAADDHIDLRGQGGQVQGLFAGRVSPADDRDRPLPVEEAVAGRAGGHAHAPVFLLGRESEITGRRSGRDDQALRLDLRLPVDGDAEGPDAQVHFRRGSGTDIGAEGCRLGTHGVHQGIGVHAAVEAREILDDGRRRELSPRFHPFVQDGRKIGSGGVDRSRESGRTAAKDETSDLFHIHFLRSLQIYTFLGNDY